jgi:hypothetical protein
MDAAKISEQIACVLVTRSSATLNLESRRVILATNRSNGIVHEDHCKGAGHHPPGGSRTRLRADDHRRAHAGLDVAWSEAALIDTANRDGIAINPIIYAEIASGFATMAALDLRFGAEEFRRPPLPYEAGFVAGSNIAGAAAYGRLRSRISPSGLMRRSRVSRC